MPTSGLINKFKIFTPTMINSTLGNDEIHHSEGKIPKGSCRVSNKSFTEESEAPPPILQSNLISKAPPGAMYMHTFEEQNKLKRLIYRFFKINPIYTLNITIVAQSSYVSFEGMMVQIGNVIIQS